MHSCELRANVCERMEYCLNFMQLMPLFSRFHFFSSTTNDNDGTEQNQEEEEEKSGDRRKSDKHESGDVN